MKYIVTITTDKDLKWVEELIKDAVQKANDPSYRGCYFTKPVKEFKVKVSKKKEKT